MIHKYIKELVENNNRVIIPDFGAFMVQSTANGKQISFNDFLKFNDGLLINQIIKTEKISKNEATDQIKAFIKEIERCFVTGKPYEIKDVGFLVKDNHGNIKFDLNPSVDKATVAATDNKPTIVLDEKKEKVEPKAESKKPAPKTKAPVKPVPKPETQKKAKVESEGMPKKEIEKPKVDSKPVLKPQVPPIKPVAVPASKPVAKQSAEKIASSILDKKNTTLASSNNSKNTKLIIIIAAVVVVLGGGTWAVLNFNLLKVFNKPGPVVEVVIIEPVIDTVPEEVVDTTEVIEVEQPKVVEEPVVDSNAKRYYIVAGSFKVASNANNYSQKLSGEGYNSEVIERSNGYYTVSYKTIYDWNEALREWRTMRNINSETWILVR